MPPTGLLVHMARYDRHSGKWAMEKTPVYHIID
jgi:hypothetical protein